MVVDALAVLALLWVGALVVVVVWALRARRHARTETEAGPASTSAEEPTPTAAATPGTDEATSQVDLSEPAAAPPVVDVTDAVRAEPSLPPQREP